VAGPAGASILVVTLLLGWAPGYYGRRWLTQHGLELWTPAGYAATQGLNLATAALANLAQGLVLVLALDAMSGQPIGLDATDVRTVLQRALRAWPSLFPAQLVMSLWTFILPLPRPGWMFDLRAVYLGLWAAQILALLMTFWVGVYAPAVVAERRSVFRGVIRADILLSGRRARFLLVMLLFGVPPQLPGVVLGIVRARPELAMGLSPGVAEFWGPLATAALGALWPAGLTAAYLECRRQREGPPPEETAGAFD